MNCNSGFRTMTRAALSSSIYLVDFEKHWS